MAMDAATLIDSWPEPQRSTALALRRIILAAEPDLAEAVKWRSPTYSLAHNLCSILCHRDHVNLQLFAGAALPDPEQRLAGSGRAMRHLRYSAPEEVDAAAVAAFVRAAAAEQRTRVAPSP